MSMHLRTYSLCSMLLIAALLAGCQPLAQSEVSRPESALVAYQSDRLLSSQARYAAASAEAARVVALPAAAASAAQPAAIAAQPGAYDRLIIKNADMQVIADDVDAAIARVNQIAADAGGYILASRVWSTTIDESTYRHASITINVPADRFEQSLGQLRAVALRVTSEQATGQDVTEEYVDLDARLTNLEATRDRIRAFLDEAQSVEEALQVNAHLSQIEGEIEQVQGRMTYLTSRAAESTITLTIDPDVPAALPPAVTAWSPGATFAQAGATFVRTAQTLIDGLIWVTVVLLPFLLPTLLVVWLIWRLGGQRRRAVPEG